MNDSTLPGKERPSPGALMGFLDVDRAWLETQPPHHPWPATKTRIASEIAVWIDSYGKARCDQPLTIAQPAAYAALAGKIWECWKLHWMEECRVKVDEEVDGMNVGERIRAGRGLRGGSLGGDVIDDLVWADGVLRGDRRAIEMFITHFDRHAEAVARQVSPRSARRMDWWDKLRTELMFRPDKPGKLASFRGESGLAPWLRRIFVREIVRSTSSDDRRPAGVDAFPGIADAKDRPPDEKIAGRECRDMVRGALRSATDALNEKDRQSIVLSFVDGLDNKQIAQLLGVNPGNSTRRRQKALEHVRQHLAEQLKRTGDSLANCLRHILKLPDGASWQDLFQDEEGQP